MKRLRPLFFDSIIAELHSFVKGQAFFAQPFLKYFHFSSEVGIE